MDADRSHLVPKTNPKRVLYNSNCRAIVGAQLNKKSEMPLFLSHFKKPKTLLTKLLNDPPDTTRPDITRYLNRQSRERGEHEAIEDGKTEREENI